MTADRYAACQLSRFADPLRDNDAADRSSSSLTVTVRHHAIDALVTKDDTLQHHRFRTHALQTTRSLAPTTETTLAACLEAGAPSWTPRSQASQARPGIWAHAELSGQMQAQRRRHPDGDTRARSLVFPPMFPAGWVRCAATRGSSPHARLLSESRGSSRPYQCAQESEAPWMQSFAQVGAAAGTCDL